MKISTKLHKEEFNNEGNKMKDSKLENKKEEKSVSYNKKQVYISMLIPIIGWIYIIIGILIFPYLLTNWILLFIWIVDVILSVGVHGAQLYFAIPEGKKANLPVWKIVCMTMLFGATFLKPLRDGVISK